MRQLRLQRRQPLGRRRVALQRGDLGLQRQHLGRLRPLERDPAREAVPHGPGQREVGGRAGHRIAGAVPGGVGALHQPALGQVRQFEVVEEEGEEFLPGQDEAEGILAAAVLGAFGATAAAAAGGALDLVALPVFLVAGQHMVADAARPVVEARLPDAMQGDADLAPCIGAADVPFGGGIADRLLHQGLRPAQEALSVGQAAAAGIQAAVKDLHRVLGLAIRFGVSRPASPACTIRPAGAPASRYSPGTPCVARTPRASSPTRHPSWSRRR
jgi:hypothetical protein